MIEQFASRIDPSQPNQLFERRAVVKKCVLLIVFLMMSTGLAEAAFECQGINEKVLVQRYFLNRDVGSVTIRNPGNESDPDETFQLRCGIGFACGRNALLEDGTIFSQHFVLYPNGNDGTYWLVVTSLRTAPNQQPYHWEYKSMMKCKDTGF